MTDDQYSELVDFLGGKFDRIDERFDRIDERFDAVEERLTRVEERLTRVEERLTRVEVFAEENRDLIRSVAERVSAFDRKLDAFREDVDRRFRAQEDLLRSSFASLDLRITSLERRVDRLEDEGG